MIIKYQAVVSDIIKSNLHEKKTRFLAKLKIKLYSNTKFHANYMLNYLIILCRYLIFPKCPSQQALNFPLQRNNT